MAPYHLLRVFCGEDGRGGNALAVFLDGDEVNPDARQRVAAALGLSETVFVDDAATGTLRIHTPTTELAFAGHPTVGTAWLLARERGPVAVLRPPAGEVPVRLTNGCAFATLRPEWSPPFAHVQLGSPADVDALSGPPGDHDLVSAWAWIDDAAGLVRARVFPLRIGVAEDEATGSAAGLLCAALGRPIDIRQGFASRIVARPVDEGRVEVGGRVATEGVRTLAHRAPPE